MSAADDRPGLPASIGQTGSLRIRALVVVCAGYALFFTWVYAKPLFTGTYLTESDLYEQYLPWFLARPMLWSPFEFAGFPTFADAQDVVGYVPYWIFGGVVHWWTAIAVSAHVLAACFTYAYVFRLTGSSPAAAFAGLAYAVSEALMERIAHMTLLHALAWLPLIAMSLDGLRETGRRGWVVAGAIGVGQCLLSGHPQIALYTYYVCLAYGIAGGWATRAPLRYYGWAAALFLIGALLTGVKSIPVLEASQLTARQDTSLSQFVGHANTPAQMLSLVYPTILHEGREAPTYVGLVTLGLAVAGASLAGRNWRVTFWLVTALVGLVMGAGASTPLPELVHQLPGYDRFRVGARHLFLAAFGAAVLAGFALAELQKHRLPDRALAAGAGVLAALLGIGAAAMAAVPGAFQFEGQDAGPPLPVWPAAIWVQFGIGLVTLLAMGVVARTRRFPVAVAALFALLAVDALHALPYAVRPTGIDAVTSSPDMIVQPSVHAARLADELRPTQQRLLPLAGSAVDPVAPAAFARVWEIPSAGGYNPMVLGSYTRTMLMDSNGAIRPYALAPENVALDLAAVKYLLVRDDDLPQPETFERDGVRWASRPLDLSIGRADCGHRYERSISLVVPVDVDVTAISMATYLRCSEDVVQGTEVASVHVSGGPDTAVVSLRAGLETAETGLSDPALEARAAHRRAQVFDDAAGPLVYVHHATLPSPARVRRLELRAPGTGGWTVVRHLTLIGADGRSYPLSAPGVWLDDRDRWREVRRFSTSRRTDRRLDESTPDEQTVTVLENTRALPRAWMVTAVEQMSEGEGLETIWRSQLPDGRRFDPRQMALVDEGDPPVPGRAPEGPATVTAEPGEGNRIRLTASSLNGGFLVLSEAFYPGWRARVDGELVAVFRTNVAYMGVAVPPGEHRIEFEFVPSSRTVGLWASWAGVIACLFLACAGAVARLNRPRFVIRDRV